MKIFPNRMLACTVCRIANAAEIAIIVAIGLGVPYGSSVTFDARLSNHSRCCSYQFRQQIEDPKLPDTNTQNKLEGMWTVTEIRDGSIPEGAEIKLEFEGGEATWHSTCNIYESKYLLEESSLSFFPVMPGKNTCGLDLVNAEKSLLRAMQRVSNFRIDETEHLILLGNETVLLKAQR